METPPSHPTPRFVFIHKIGIGNLPQKEGLELLAEIRNALTVQKQQQLPIIEFFIPIRDTAAPEYTLTIVDLASLNTVMV
jgi:hypothetical protein